MTVGSDNQWPPALTVKAWLKAFIPGDYPDTIDGVGAASGHKLLVGPCSWFNDCFHTDNRTFSADIAASCRMHSEFELDLANHELREVHYCGETVEYDCEAGEVECRATAATTGMRFGNLRWEGQHVILVDVTGFANNPCLRGSPDIGYTGSFAVDLAGQTVTFTGRVHGFPAYEAYAVVNGGPAATVFTYGPRGGPSALTGVAADPVTGTARF
jgi:hypothetical protein